MPLSIVKERLDRLQTSLGTTPEAGAAETPLSLELKRLQEIYAYLESRGAKLTWRDKRR